MSRAKKLRYYNNYLKVIFYYSSMSEEGVIQETLKDWQFIIENNYEYWMPDGVNPDSSINNIRAAIKNELILERINKVKTSFKESLKENIFHLKNFADQVGLPLPHQIFVTLTQYGTGGSYELPNQVFINIRSNYGDPFSTFVHELVHLLIETSIVKRYRLSHSAKEGLVDYLILHSPHLQQIVPQYSVQDGMNTPSYQQLNKWFPGYNLLQHNIMQ